MIIWDIKKRAQLKKDIYLWNEYTKDKGVNSILFFIEENSEKIRSRYIKFINELGNKKYNGKSVIEHLYIEKKFSYWWLTLLAEKSLYKQESIHQVLKIIALDEILKRKQIKYIKLVSADLNLHKTLKYFCKEKKIPYSFDRKTDLGKYFVSFNLKEIFKKIFAKEIISILILIKYCYLRKNFFNKKIINFKESKKTFFIMSYFTNFNFKSLLKNQYKSNYWDGLNYLSKFSKSSVNWLQIFIPGPKTKNSKIANNQIKKIKAKKNEIFFFIEYYLDYKVVLFVISQWIILTIKYYKMFKFNKLFFLENSKMNLWHLLKNDWKNSMCGPVAINNLFYVKIFDSLFKKINTQHKGIYLMENISFEKALIFYWKKYKHKKLIGVQSTTLRFWDLRYHFPLKAINAKGKSIMPQPDYISVNGQDAYKQFLKIGYNQKKLIKSEALRYQHLIGVKSKQKIKKKLTILIVGDYSRDSTNSLLKLIEISLKSFNYKNKIIFKPHPLTPVNLNKFNISKINEVSGPTSQFVKKVDCVFSTNTTAAALDFYLAGVKVFVMLDRGKVNFSPLKGHKNVDFVYSKKSLLSSLNKFITSKKKNSIKKDFFYNDKKLTKWKNILL